MKKILVIEDQLQITIELLYETRLDNYWASSFAGADDFFKEINFDIVVINIKISEERVTQILKNSKVIILSSAVNRGIIDFIIDISSNQDFFFVNNEKEAIQTVLDCLK